MLEIISENWQTVISKNDGGKDRNLFKLTFQNLIEKSKKLFNLLTDERFGEEGWIRSVIHQKMPFFSQRSC